MCGITGYIGKKDAKEVLIKNLKLLEYRGYDSAGLAFLKNNKITTEKSIGNIEKLEKKALKISGFYCGIGHTRWATNGGVNLKNCHPHISFDSKLALVHNGIIENVNYLKHKYLNNVNFKSETDTEVVAHLIAIQSGNNLEKFSKALKLLKGSYAFAVIFSDEEETIYIAKNKSPLYFANNDFEVVIASDPICFAENKTNYFTINDFNLARIKCNEIEIYDLFLNKKKPFLFSLNEQYLDISKQGYSHFMLKEIKETKKALKNICEKYRDEKIFGFDESYIKNINKVKIIGCGTAYNSALLGASFFKSILKIESEACIASEFRYSKPLIDKNALCIFVSQSGETADTLESLKLAKRRGAKIISLTNVDYSSIAKISKKTLPICAGREVAVASTKAYTCQVAVFYLLTNYILSLYRKKGVYLQAIKDIKKLSSNIDIFDLYQTKQIANFIKNVDKVFFLGRGEDYFTSLEASLKLKEVSYINSSAYPTGELKHGYIALIEKGTPVFVFATSKNLINKTINGINEVASRGGKVHLISSLDLKEDELKNINSFIKINAKGIKNKLYPLLSIIFAQYLAYFTSVAKNLNPDEPRNLAKSVTVE